MRTDGSFHHNPSRKFGFYSITIHHKVDPDSLLPTLDYVGAKNDCSLPPGNLNDITYPLLGKQNALPCTRICEFFWNSFHGTI